MRPDITLPLPDPPQRFSQHLLRVWTQVLLTLRNPRLGEESNMVMDKDSYIQDSQL